MRNILLTLILFFPVLFFGQKPLRDSIYIKSDIFDLVYSEKLQQPKWIKYTVKCANGTAPRTGMDFFVCDTIVTSDNKDYENNHYDKGHLAPAAAFNCTKEMLNKTFTYLNCTLQQENLNRGAWRLLEAHERDLAAVGRSVDVVIVLDFTNAQKLPTHLLPCFFVLEHTFNFI